MSSSNVIALRASEDRGASFEVVQILCSRVRLSDIRLDWTSP